MKKLLIFYILFLSVFLASCDDPKPMIVREWPHLETIEIVGNSTSGFVLHGAIITEGNTDILRYGFSISKSEILVLDNGELVFSDNRADNKFSAEITDYMVSGEKYYLRAYAEVKGYNVYAEALEFEY